jgi:hypothetical protein
VVALTRLGARALGDVGSGICNAAEHADVRLSGDHRMLNAVAHAHEGGRWLATAIGKASYRIS